MKELTPEQRFTRINETRAALYSKMDEQIYMLRKAMDCYLAGDEVDALRFLRFACACDNEQKQIIAYRMGALEQWR
jgi:hypothetical protein